MSNLARALAARERLVRALEPRIEAARACAGWDVGPVGSPRARRRRCADRARGRRAGAAPLLGGVRHDGELGLVVLPCAGAAPGASGAIAAEMEAVVGEDIGEIMSAKLPVTDAFVREIERMYPSVLFFPRIAMEDIEFNGFTIPKGTPTFIRLI